MKFPCFHKFYTINVFIYLIFINVLSTIISFAWIFNIELTYIWAQSVIITLLTMVMLLIGIPCIFIELILRQKSYITKCNTITVNNKVKNMVYIFAIIAIFSAYTALLVEILILIIQYIQKRKFYVKSNFLLNSKFYNIVYIY